MFYVCILKKKLRHCGGIHVYRAPKMTFADKKVKRPYAHVTVPGLCQSRFPDTKACRLFSPNVT